MRTFHALEVALEIVSALREVIAKLRQLDKDLADEVRRAAKSVALNVAEGSRRVGRDRPHSYSIAAGSADEVRTALRVAKAFGYLDDAEIARPLELIDRELAMLWRLVRPRRA